MLIAIGSDHAGFEAKQGLIPFLIELGHQVEDLGTCSTESVDYPDFGHAVGRAVADSKAERGIVICGTGLGISMAANKIRGIRAAVCPTTDHAELSRKHNNANVLAMGARLTPLAEMKKITRVWLDTAFEGGRHINRVAKIEV